MTTMISNPVIHAPTSGSAHCSRNPSPTASPSLRPLASSMAKSPTPSGPGSNVTSPRVPPMSLPSSSNPLPLPASAFSTSSSSSRYPDPTRLTPPTSPQMSSRSFARAPPVRPYASPMLSRGMSAGSRPLKPVDGDTKEFAEQVVKIFNARSKHVRTGRIPEGVVDEGDRVRKGRSLGGSLSDHWEGDKPEFIVDIPVWSPGCFQDLSTLHALRDTTLSHTHTLLAYLQSAHSLSASYRLLARSCAPSSVPGSPRSGPAPLRPVSPVPVNLNHCASTHSHIGWGCIRLCPGVASPILPKNELKPHVRRSSMVIHPSSSGRNRSRSGSRSQSQNRFSSSGGSNRAGTSPKRSMDIPEFKLDFDHAIADEPEDDDVPVELKEGYTSAGSAHGSDDEQEEESADSIIAKEVERRKVKEGSVFLMTLYGQPALILT